MVLQELKSRSFDSAEERFAQRLSVLESELFIRAVTRHDKVDWNPSHSFSAPRLSGES